MPLPTDLVDLLSAAPQAYLATVMPDGSPQLTQVWVDTDGEHVVVNTVLGHQKARNIARDPRVAINVADPARPAKYWFVRGECGDVTRTGAAEHIDELAQRYTGAAYQWYGGRDQVRLKVTIRADSVHTMG